MVVAHMYAITSGVPFLVPVTLDIFYKPIKGRAMTQMNVPFRMDIVPIFARTHQARTNVAVHRDFNYIDECQSGTSSCSDICINTPGSFSCKCGNGFVLDSNGEKCIDINDCKGVICENGGICIDNVGSYTCACMAGFTGQHCNLDVNECAGYLNGGCEDTCINTEEMTIRRKISFQNTISDGDFYHMAALL
ncbi:hypothetical protein DPMN_169982 [Dreissena polymorpha]|uniref:EGF-like domain-containing protein n=1 Tax=Dreissena polymorpha TaxID=45954 RepID=A0A9D4DYF8_DREPO|nr:hypothetical protein DPMN_169982 [Dreissena polymorpha]